MSVQYSSEKSASLDVQVSIYLRVYLREIIKIDLI